MFKNILVDMVMLVQNITRFLAESGQKGTACQDQQLLYLYHILLVLYAATHCKDI